MIETGAAGRHALHPIVVVGSASSHEDRRREVSRSAPTSSGKQNTTDVRLMPIISTHARQDLATTPRPRQRISGECKVFGGGLFTKIPEILAQKIAK